MTNNNFRILILGYGSIGKCISKVLHGLEYEVAVAENCYVLDNSGLKFYKADLQFELDFNEVLEDFKPHIVISALPYFLNKRIAEICVEKNIHYMDLGGHLDTHLKINKLNPKNSLVLDSLGLAPGWINICAEHLFEKYKDNVDTINMYVGGIPIKKEIGGPLSYLKSWSIDGLINEYIDDCQVLENGEIINKKALDGIVYICDDYVKDSSPYFYEAFYTSGGAAHSLNSLRDKGLQNCAYRTLRYPGHADLMKWLLTSNIGKDNIEKLIDNVGDDNKRENHKVVLRCQALDKNNRVLDAYNNLVFSSVNFSAMQRATALPVVSVIQLISSGLLNKTGCLTYSDIPYGPFSANLTALLENPSF